MMFEDDWADEDEPVLGSYDWEELEADAERDKDGDYWRQLLHKRG